MSDTSTPPPEPNPRVSALADDVVATVVPEAVGLERRARNRRIAVSLAFTAMVTVLGVLAARGTDWFFAEHDARVASEADDKIDHEGPAFTASMRLDTQSSEAALFDAPFSAEDKRTLLGMSKEDGKLQPFMEARHGRHVSYSDVRHSAMGISYRGYSEAWLMDLLSDRQAGLVINDLRIKGLSCTPAKAVTAIEIQGQGVGGYDGMLFDLTRTDPVPLDTAADENFGKPFFAHRKIDLGNGATPGGLRIEVTSGTKDCTWKAFEATYVDSEGTHTQEITNDGKGFTVHGIAAQREQTFQARATDPFVTECTVSAQGELSC
ncbi:hypothetical protein [Streptomyces justiciae]|uniref:Uncharacterized protein n=1 Tax=Streptomyces justiciae TaxID=2780140 RepID=A0ABU3LPL8_9ACTN|nr:hypothetical protein [Streptomyces justiciae]MDT7841013.1 hypothetical protein [Streptomyces justiciae]